ncbi:MAG: YgcG family protein [Gammaproteobacteria bacterium]|nr:YgcG family protein [Gammaproteobacteria bacterium]
MYVETEKRENEKLRKSVFSFLFVLVSFLWLLPAVADDLVPVPPLQARVTDLTGTLTPQQQAQLERTLSAFEAQKGSQIAVLIVPTTQPEAVEQYGIRVAEQWKLGRKGIDDGALLLVAKDDRAMRIEVGYGLEGVLTDATSKRIISEITTPRFKEGDFYGGIAAGVDQMIRVVEGEPLPPPKVSAPGVISGIEQFLPVAFLLAVVGGAVLRAMLGRFPGALATGGVVALLAWLFVSSVIVALIAGIIAFVLTLAGGMGRGGGWSSGGGGFGRGGGGFGGGFGGGGGGFGGGGASGRW